MIFFPSPHIVFVFSNLLFFTGLLFLSQPSKLMNAQMSGNLDNILESLIITEGLGSRSMWVRLTDYSSMTNYIGLLGTAPVLTLRVPCARKLFSSDWGHPRWDHLCGVNCLEMFTGSPMSLVLFSQAGRFPSECNSHFLHGGQSPTCETFLGFGWGNAAEILSFPHESSLQLSPELHLVFPIPYSLRSCHASGTVLSTGWAAVNKT